MPNLQFFYLLYCCWQPTDSITLLLCLCKTVVWLCFCKVSVLYWIRRIQRKMPAHCNQLIVVNFSSTNKHRDMDLFPSLKSREMIASGSAMTPRLCESCFITFFRRTYYFYPNFEQTTWFFVIRTRWIDIVVLYMFNWWTGIISVTKTALHCIVRLVKMLQLMMIFCVCFIPAAAASEWWVYLACVGTFYCFYCIIIYKWLSLSSWCSRYSLSQWVQILIRV